MEQTQLFKGRDKRKKGWFWMDNEYLNGYAKHFGAVGTAIYVSLCRHADNDTQKCFPAQEQIAEELHITPRTVRRYLKLFEQFHLISIEREKDPRTKKWLNNVYTLLDKSEWATPEEIASYGKPEENNDTSQRKITTEARGHQRPNKETHINNTHINNTNIVGDTSNSGSKENNTNKEEKPFSLEEYIKSLIDSPRRDLHIIGIYWQRKRPIVDNKKAAEKELKMLLKAGKELEDFSDERIFETMNYLEDYADFKWNLYTVRKYITEDLDDLIYKAKLKEGRADPFRRKF